MRLDTGHGTFAVDRQKHTITRLVDIDTDSLKNSARISRPPISMGHDVMRSSALRRVHSGRLEVSPLTARPVAAAGATLVTSAEKLRVSLAPSSSVTVTVIV